MTHIKHHEESWKYFFYLESGEENVIENGQHGYMDTITILNMVTIIILNMVTITNWSLEVMPQGSTGRNLADALLTKEVLLNIILI